MVLPYIQLFSYLTIHLLNPLQLKSVVEPPCSPININTVYSNFFFFYPSIMSCYHYSLKKINIYLGLHLLNFLLTIAISSNFEFNQ